MNRRILYQQFAEGGVEEASIPAPRTENDQMELNALRNASIKMPDTSYVCFLVQQKKDAERAHKKMSAREEAAFKWKMAEIDEAGVGDGQSPPPSLTSV